MEMELMEHQPEPVQFLGWILAPTGARNSASRFGTLNRKPPRVTSGGPPLLGLWFARRLSERRALSSTKLRTRGVWSPPQGGIIGGRSCLAASDDSHQDTALPCEVPLLVQSGAFNQKARSGLRNLDRAERVRKPEDIRSDGIDMNLNPVTVRKRNEVRLLERGAVGVVHVAGWHHEAGPRASLE